MISLQSSGQLLAVKFLFIWYSRTDAKFSPYPKSIRNWLRNTINGKINTQMIKKQQQQQMQGHERRAIRVPDELIKADPQIAAKIHQLFESIMRDVEAELNNKYKEYCQTLEEHNYELYSNSSVMSLGIPLYHSSEHSKQVKQKQSLSRHSLDSQSGVEMKRSKSTNIKNKAAKPKKRRRKSQADEPDPQV